MKIHIREGDIRLIDLRTRIPFKYGIATMTQAPHAFVRLQVEIDGKFATGIAADLLPPKWFTKDPAKPLDAEVDEMLRVIEHAVEIASEIRGYSVFNVWQQLYNAQAAWGCNQNVPPLLTSFGMSLVERALIQAVCEKSGRPFAPLLHTDELGIHLSHIHPDLTDRSLTEFLPPRPLNRIIARHTIGLADPLADSDIPSAERIDDGLPQSLAACIRRYGLRHFKIKVSGELDRDLERLRRVATLIAEAAPPEFAISLDGNEQFRTLDQFRTFWEAVRRIPQLQPFLSHLLFVEQPLHRDAALQPKAMADLIGWTERPPIIIDESDAELDSLPRALELGYAGTSHKNCKGVFRSIANFCLLANCRSIAPRTPFILSGEDLANIGPVALLQDLAVCAALGIGSVERNGHHYFAGLSMFPHEVQRHVLAHHGDLYHASRDGWPTLTIRDGLLDVRSVVAAPFGVGFPLDVGQFLTVDAWRRSHNTVSAAKE